MNRGDVYRLSKPPGNDPKKYRYFVIVSRDALIASNYSTVICAPIYSRYDGLATQVLIDLIDVEEGVQHPSSIHCDSLMSIRKGQLTHYVGRLSPPKLRQLSISLAIALDIYRDEL